MASFAKRAIEYIQEADQVRAEELIDTESKQVPTIPHGSLSDGTFQRLRTLVEGISRSGQIKFSETNSGMENETAENKDHLKEAYDNMHAYPLPRTVVPVAINDFQRKHKERNDPSKLTIRQTWNKQARSMLAEVGEPDAQRFQVLSVRVVEDAARRYHIDRLGLGPSVLVGVMEADDEYRVLFAAVKQGVCPQDGMRRNGKENEEGFGVYR